MPRIPCIVFKQKNEIRCPRFALFAAPAGEILQWASIPRSREDPEGHQRKLNVSKVNAMKRFLEVEGNSVPPAVIVSLRIGDQQILSPNLQNEDLGSVKILDFQVEDNVEDDEKPGIVIDGQHRLKAIEAYDPRAKVSVVALLDVDPTETAFQFVVINNKVTRVSHDLIRTLALRYSEDVLADRLRSARIPLHKNLQFVEIAAYDSSSPFRDHIALETPEREDEMHFVAPAAIENSVSVIQRQGVTELENEDALCDFFFAIWRAINERQGWADLWNLNSKLMKKVSIVAMTTYMAKALIARYDWDQLDVTNPEDVERAAQDILNMQDPQFWRCEWNTRVSDTPAVREMLIESLTRISRNIRSGRPWQQDVDIVTL